MKPGSRPRIPPLPVEQFDGQVRETLSEGLLAGRADRYFSSGPNVIPMPNILATLAHHPKLAVTWVAFNEVLLRTPALPVRQRELALLRVAYRTRASYEWTQHVRLSPQFGINADEVAALAVGASAATWAPLERHILAATDQLLDRYNVDDETWAALAEEFNERQLLELLFLVGSRACIAIVFNSCGLQMDSDVPVIPFPSGP